jgi:hypothetical protein
LNPCHGPFDFKKYYAEKMLQSRKFKRVNELKIEMIKRKFPGTKEEVIQVWLLKVWETIFVRFVRNIEVQRAIDRKLFTGDIALDDEDDDDEDTCSN